MIQQRAAQRDENPMLQAGPSDESFEDFRLGGTHNGCVSRCSMSPQKGEKIFKISSDKESIHWNGKLKSNTSWNTVFIKVSKLKDLKLK